MTLNNAVVDPTGRGGGGGGGGGALGLPAHPSIGFIITVLIGHNSKS